MIHQLHDEVDLDEELREKAAEVVRKIIDERLQEAFELSKSAADPETEVFRILAVWAENELAGLTTEAVRRMYDLTRKRLA